MPVSSFRYPGVLLALLLAAPAQAQLGQALAEPAWPSEAVAAERWRAPALAAKSSASVTLMPVESGRLDALRRHNEAPGLRRRQVGFARALATELDGPLPALTWQPAPGGQVATLSIASPEAAGLRLGLRPDRLPEAAELRVAGSAYGGIVHAIDMATARSRVDGAGLYWTAATDGPAQRLELFLPDGAGSAGPGAAVESVAHLLMAPQSGQFIAKGLGDSGSCNVDVVCRNGALGANYVQATDAVARMLFQSGGGSFTCTGTLLADNDPGTQIPWFFTAQHCIATQAEANTLITFWRNQTPTCNVDMAGLNSQLASGAELLYAQSATDGALLRLNGTPPAHAVFAGWNANALTANSPVVTIHHPSGDIKKVSQGNHSGASANVNIDGQVVTGTWRASWAEGTTEGGSSGAGLFSIGAGGYQLRGGLFGGSASCANVGQSEAAGNVDFYSRLDQIYPAISQYIDSAGSGPSHDYTGIWYQPAEDGRGLSLNAFGDNLFGLWFVYDSQGRASWYQIDPTWTAADVASGRVVRWSGSPWGPTYNPADRSLVEVGQFTLTFTSPTQATFAYNVDGVARTITLFKLGQ